MTIKNKLLSLLLALAMLLPVAALPLSALAPRVSDADALTFTNGTVASATVSPSRLLSMLLGEPISSAEADYLDRYCDRILSYYDRIPADRVSMISDGDRLSLTAMAYTYEADNGATVTWVPVEAVYADRAGTPFVKNGATYEATLEGVTRETADRVGIVYEATLSIPAGVVNAIAGLAYTDATAAESLPTTAEYAAARAAYLAYLSAMDAYEDASAAHEQYLRDLQAFRDEKALYDAYLVKKGEYEQKQAAYVQYTDVDLPAYIAAKAEYDRAYRENEAVGAAYMAYLNNLGRIRSSMAAIESLFDRPTSGKTRPLYEALQNQELVTMFERYRDELVRIYGVSDATLTKLYQSSNDLNAMLGEYAEARKTSEEAAFAYYLAHYRDLSRLFNYLYDSMREIMTGMIFNHICTKMELEYRGEELTYKKWRVKNILAHIYLICQALDDAEMADGTFGFYAENGKKHTYYFSDLLDQNLILTDTNSSCPDGLSWMPAVEPPKALTPPTEPTVVERPTPPTVVDEPEEPAFVDEPTKPQDVTRVEEATPEELALYAFRDRASAIVAEKKAGTLVARPAATAETRLSLRVTLTRAIAFDNATLVSFYAIDGSIFHVVEVARGEAYELPSVGPSYDDAQYTYSFAGWATSPDADPSSLGLPPATAEGDLSLYAIYHKTVKQYTVTVKLDEDDPMPTVTAYAFGTRPSLPESPTKPMTADTVYTFAGWSPEVTAVTGHVTYVAQWLSSERLYTVRWETPSGIVERSLPYRSTPTPPTVPAIRYEGCVRYDFIGWGRPIEAVAAGTTYTAQYRRTVLAESEEGALVLTPSLGAYHVESDAARVNVAGLLAQARTEAKRVTLALPDLTVTLDAAAVSALSAEGAATAAVLRDTSGGIGIGFYDANGNRVSTSIGVISLAVPYTPVEGGYPCVLADDGAGHVFLVSATVEDDGLAVAATPHRTYRATHQYALTLKSEGGTVFATNSRYLAGEAVGLTTYPLPNHRLSAITLTDDRTGESQTLSSLTQFVMPDYPATLSVTFVPITYTVTFLYRGEAISTGQYLLGDTVAIPKIVTDFEENGYRYTFIGWSTPITAVTGDATYTAKFFSMPIEQVPDNPEGEAWATGTALWQVGLPVILILGLLIACIVVLTVLCVRTCKKKKKNNKKTKKEQEKHTHE